MNCHGFAHIIIILKTQLIKKELKFLSSFLSCYTSKESANLK